MEYFIFAGEVDTLDTATEALADADKKAKQALTDLGAAEDNDDDAAEDAAKASKPAKTSKVCKTSKAPKAKAKASKAGPK